MAQSYQDVVRDALQLLGVITEIDAPSAEQGVHGLRALNDMMAFWASDNIDVEYVPSDDLTAEIDINTSALRAVKHGLAIALAPYYARPVSAELYASFDSLYRVLVRDSVISQMEPADMSHMHSGTGHNVDFDYY